jgi:hypothetical protein
MEEAMIDLMTPVKVGIPAGNVIEWKPAVLVGRTIESQPRYDVRLIEGGYLSGVPDAFVEQMPLYCPAIDGTAA